MSAKMSLRPCRTASSSTIPKRLRIYFRFNRELLGHLPKLAYELIREVYQAVLGREDAVPGMVAAVQTFGELAHWHPHVHAIASDGVFTEGGVFITLPPLAVEPFLKLWEHKIFKLLLDEGRITPETVDQMRTWRHSGFSAEIKGLDFCICIFSVAEKIHTIRYYGWYSNKSRGMKAKLAATGKSTEPAVDSEEEDTPFLNLCRSRWAALIKKVYEIDPLVCPKCGGRMRIISFIEKRDRAAIIQKILKHCGLWTEPEERAPPADDFQLDSVYVPIDEFLASF